MVSDGVASQLKINFITIQSYRIYSYRSKLDIYPLLSQQNCKKKIGSMNFQFFSVWRLYAHKLHAPCSQAPRSCLHASVVGSTKKAEQPGQIYIAFGPTMAGIVAECGSD